MYSVYAVTLILIPPWMSYQDETTGARHMTIAGTLHRTLFTAIAAIAVASHFKAMTTDPGAVPPDARPLECADVPSLDESTSSSQTQKLLEASTSPKPPPQVKRLCRRCKSFKPARAHHCSICRRCIIKMDHHCPWVNNVSSRNERSNEEMAKIVSHLYVCHFFRDTTVRWDRKSQVLFTLRLLYVHFLHVQSHFGGDTLFHVRGGLTIAPSPQAPPPQ